MIGYVTLGTNNMDRAAKFYDELLGELGAKRGMENERFIAWTSGVENTPMLSIIKPYDEKDACVGNGVMIALVVDSTDKVDAIHAKALALGAADEGAVGERMPGFYAGYFRDMDGNKLNVFCMG